LTGGKISDTYLTRSPIDRRQEPRMKHDEKKAEIDAYKKHKAIPGFFAALANSPSNLSI
jgi:hypothetical protein